MKKLNRGPTSLHSTLLLDLKDDDPDWESIQENAAEYAKQTAFLLKNKPTKGEAASWETFAKSYNTDARALDAAAKRKDARGASGVLKRMSNACMACHKAHKPE
jgi:cytochrome c556